MITLRREFTPLPQDLEFLEDYGLPWETIVDGSQWFLIHELPTHEGYNHPRVTAAIRIETGYPQAELNMVYFFPALARKDGKAIGATQTIQQLDGKAFQRWSRHRTGQNPWKAGRDHLGTHVLMVEDWLAREFEK
jgi:E2/UBC family protein E